MLSDATDFNLHVLTHEIWWQKEIMSPKEKIQKCVDMSAKSIINTYNDALPRLNLMNIDWK